MYDRAADPGSAVAVAVRYVHVPGVWRLLSEGVSLRVPTPRAQRVDGLSAQRGPKESFRTHQLNLCAGKDP